MKLIIKAANLFISIMKKMFKKCLWKVFLYAQVSFFTNHKAILMDCSLISFYIGRSSVLNLASVISDVWQYYQLNRTFYLFVSQIFVWNAIKNYLGVKKYNLLWTWYSNFNVTRNRYFCGYSFFICFILNCLKCKVYKQHSFSHSYEQTYKYNIWFDFGISLFNRKTFMKDI